MDEVKLKGMPNQLYHNNHLQNIGFDVEEGDDLNTNQKIVAKNLEVFNLSDIDITDADAVKKRIMEYFSIEAKWGFKPSIAGLANSLGLNRTVLWQIKTGNFGNTRGKVTRLPAQVTNEIKKAYAFMEQSWEDYMLNGKINPVTGIFLGKNNYGYRDQVEHVITPNTDSPEYSEAEIRQRLGLPDEGESSTDE